MNKNRQIISELQDFFKHNNASRAIQAITTVMNGLTIQSKVVGPVKKNDETSSEKSHNHALRASPALSYQSS